MQGFFMLGFFMIVVGIPVIAGVWAGHQKEKMKLRARELEIMGAQAAERAARHAAQTERLEERVRVLERLATDRGLTLSDEIETLRDRPAAGALDDRSRP